MDSSPQETAPGANRGPHPGAVFISYASQDTVAAVRICDALRSADIQVWFDQSELRGGDAWDQKIRSRIRDCTLLVEAQSRDPRPDARYSNARGNYQIAGGNWSAAIETYRHALVTDPLSPILLISLAECFIGAQQLEEAQDTLKRVQFVAPDLDGLHGDMAFLLLQQGSAERALVEAKLETEENSKALALVAIYHALGRTRESDGVVAVIEQKLGANQPTSVADAYALAGNKDRAMEWLNRAIKKNDPNLQSIRGDYYLYSLRDVAAYQEMLRHLRAPTELAPIS